MNIALFQQMYGYILRKSPSTGEGSKGGKVIGHTPSGKPIYDSEGRTTGGVSGRKPFPGEDQHKNAPNEPQKRKTFMPIDGTDHGRHDPPNLKAYKTLLRAFKRQGVDFMGKISYDPKTDHMIALTPDAPELIRKVYTAFMTEHQAKQPKPKPKAG